MGYYTYYSLEHDCTDAEVFERIVDEMNRLNITGYAFDVIPETLRFGTIDCVKWYDWEEDMRKVSAAFPDVHFTLRGDGEDSGDMWYAHFLGGKMQYCPAKITYDDFDPKQLR